MVTDAARTGADAARVDAGAPRIPLLRAESIVRRYGTRTVLDLPALELNAGEVLAVVGPNGAGKSTLFRVLALVERPDAGAVYLNGVDAQQLDDVQRRAIVGVFQRPVLFSGTVRDNVMFGLRARGQRSAEAALRADEALAWLGLTSLSKASVHGLSGGEAQRVALARALVLEPDVLLLDEPTANLDVTVRRRFRDDLERVARQRARGTILVTHDAAEAFSLADRVAVLQDGRLVQAGTPDEILLRPGTPFVAQLTGAELGLDGIVADEADGLVTVATDGGFTVQGTAQERLARGSGVVVAYRPEDVVLAPAGEPLESSASNRLALRVAALVPAGPLVRVRLEGDGGGYVVALVTRRSAEHLGLDSGVEVAAYIKTAALHVWRRERHD